VYDEVARGTDDLANWFRQRRENGLCVSPNAKIQGHYGTIANHINGKHKVQHVAEFLKGGDGWVIAHAMQDMGVVVTQETLRSYRSKIKVPTVCQQLSVKCINTFQMLEALNARF
jgi:hypothetical protein